MGNVKIPYYVVKKGRGYWQPKKSMHALGFLPARCGPDGPAAWARAEQLNREWQLFRHGLQATPAPTHPRGSISEAFARLKGTHEWLRMEPRTREDWERGQRSIEPVFGTVAPRTVRFEHLDAFYAAVLRDRGVSEAYRAVKHWRRLWKRMAAMGYCDTQADPSLGIRRVTPQPRSQVWREGEVVRLVKRAIRARYFGLACIIAVAWDTQFSPVDVRKLTLNHLREIDGELVFEALRREKTGKAILGTLSRKTARLVRAYIEAQREENLCGHPLFRHRKGGAYSKDTLGDDFRSVRAEVFPGDKRVLMDMRRSGAVEASAGEVDPNLLAAKMGNTINTSRSLQETYQPVSLAAVRGADEARKRGRRRIREAGS